MILTKQKGMTGIGWLVVLALIGFFVTLALKVIPIQLESYKVKSALVRLEQVPQITKMTKKEIVRILQDQFSIEDVDSVTKDHISVNKEKGVLTITIEYENRKSFIKPYEIVGVFKEEVRIIEN